MVSFLEITLPGPGSLEATPYRAAASALVCIFLLVASFSALTVRPTVDTALGWHDRWLGVWTHFKAVHWTPLFSQPGPQMWPTDVDTDVLDNQEDKDAGSNGVFSTTAAQSTEFAHIDLNRYVWHRDLHWDPKTSPGRLVIIGDVHGMIASLRAILEAVSFTKGTDVVVLVGDLVAKAPRIGDSVDVIAFARTIGALAVRGNHDQQVIKMRMAQDLNRLDAIASESQKSQHFEIARQLPAQDVEWMLNRPLTLHLRALHTFIVHAGLLPISLPTREKGQPRMNQLEDLESSSLTHFSPTPETKARMEGDDVLLLHTANTEPDTLLNMRGVTKNGSHPHHDGKRGRPWPEIWDEMMGPCRIGEACQQVNVVYGHWAKRGLSIGHSTLGLDSGCVYGRTLSALILGPDGTSSNAFSAGVEQQSVEFAGRKATIISLSCSGVEI